MVMRLSSGPSGRSTLFKDMVFGKNKPVTAAPAPPPAIRAPTYRPPVNFSPIPAPQPVYQQAYANNLAAIGGGGGGSQIISPGVINPAPVAPPPPPKPLFTDKSSNADIGRVDTTFRDQQTNYDTALEKFLADLKLKRTSLDRDTKFAKEGISKNREIGMVGVGEDFAARGLGHSGMFFKAKDDADASYGRQETAVNSAEEDAANNLNFAETKEKSDHTAKIQAARRDALYRLQLNNNLVSQ